MRLSLYNPNQREQCLKSTVKLDGYALSKCVIADEERGVAIVLRHEPALSAIGSLVAKMQLVRPGWQPPGAGAYHGDLYAVVKGRVEITFPDAEQVAKDTYPGSNAEVRYVDDLSPLEACMLLEIVRHRHAGGLTLVDTFSSRRPDPAGAAWSLEGCDPVRDIMELDKSLRGSADALLPKEVQGRYGERASKPTTSQDAAAWDARAAQHAVEAAGEEARDEGGD